MKTYFINHATSTPSLPFYEAGLAEGEGRLSSWLFWGLLIIRKDMFTNIFPLSDFLAGLAEKRGTEGVRTEILKRKKIVFWGRYIG
jgi:hypothetical protein